MPIDWTSAPELDEWVGENNIDPKYEYSKGLVGLHRARPRPAAQVRHDRRASSGHYVVQTPPPEEDLPMPAIALVRGQALVALRLDFGALCRWPKEWTVSIRRPSPYGGPTLRLIDPAFDLRRARVDGLAPDFVFGPYRENPAEFTCEEEDEWDVVTLLRLVLHEV